MRVRVHGLQEQQHAELMVQREQAEEQLRRQCEELRAHGQKELQQVQEELASLQQDFKQSLLQAESQKQQVCGVVCGVSGSVGSVY